MKQSAYNVWVARGTKRYVYNGVSGALLRLEEDEYLDALRFVSGESLGCSPTVLEQLVRGRMLVADDLNELDLLRQRHKTSQRARSHLGLTLVTSLGCNFDCPYCFEDKHPSVMNEKIEASVLRLVEDQLPKIRSLMVTWFGGEPLIGQRPLFRLSDAFIQSCSRSNVSYSAMIITNGYLLTEEICAKLREAKVGTAQVTVDGPPEVHDRMRPLVNGSGTFWDIVKNLRHAVNYMSVSVRVNVDTENIAKTRELLEILACEGLSKKLDVYLGHIVGGSDSLAGPSSTYRPPCLASAEFAKAEIEFRRIAAELGFGKPYLPRPAGAPCTAVRTNELVIGSKGELYKCWENVGDAREIVGHIDDYENIESRTSKWFRYDPFANDECKGCIALPVCMGGCAQHAMDKLNYHNRCGTFRHTFLEQVTNFVEHAERTKRKALVQTNQLEPRMETR